MMIGRRETGDWRDSVLSWPKGAGRYRLMRCYDGMGRWHLAAERDAATRQVSRPATSRCTLPPWKWPCQCLFGSSECLSYFRPGSPADTSFLVPSINRGRSPCLSLCFGGEKCCVQILHQDGELERVLTCQVAAVPFFSCRPIQFCGSIEL